MDQSPQPHTARRTGVARPRTSQQHLRVHHDDYALQRDVYITTNWTPRLLLHHYLQLLTFEVNLVRAEAGIRPVRLHTALCIAASRQNFDIAFVQGESPGHVNVLGECLWERMQDVGYEAGYVGEIVWRNGEECREVVQRWKGHRECNRKVLSRESKDVGFHCGRGAGGVMYWTAVFAQMKQEFFGSMDSRELVGYE